MNRRKFYYKCFTVGLGDTISISEWKPKAIAFGILTAVLGTFIYWVLGGEENAKQQVLQILSYGGLGAAASFAMFLFVSCLDAPYRIRVGNENDKLKLQRKVDELESGHPKLAIQFVDNDASFISGDGYFRVRIENLSTAFSAHNVKASIAEVVPLGNDNLVARKAAACRLKDMPLFADPNVNDPDKELDIHGGSSAFVPVVHSRYSEMITIGHQRLKSRYYVPEGAYRIMIAVCGDKCFGDRKTFVAGVNSKSGIIFELDKTV